MNLPKFLLNRKHRFWLFQVSGWFIYGIIDLYADSQMTGPYVMSTRHVWAWFFSLLAGFGLSLLIRLVYRSLYRRSYSIVTYVVISILCSIIGSLVWLTVKDIVELFLELRMPYSVWSNRAEFAFIDYMMINMLSLSSPLFAWSFLYFGYKLIEDLNIEKGKYQETLLLAKEAQLQMLRYQINPHFLFNSLNSIQALMYKNTALADEMLTEFSEFLRYTLEIKNELYVNLEDEIDIISKYLYIEKIRFQERLKYNVEISDNTRKIKILSFILQPFVENAIKHGFKSKQEILNIHIKSIILEGSLIITIRNSGKWICSDEQTGIGIENVRSRLENAYPGKHFLSIEDKNDWVITKLQLSLKYD